MSLKTVPSAFWREQYWRSSRHCQRSGEQGTVLSIKTVQLLFW